MNISFIARTILMMFLWCILVAKAEDQRPASLVGHYYLQSLSEVGSELLLLANGKFEWILSYGAMDRQASGTWHAKDGKVILESASPSGSPTFRLFEEDEMRIRKPAAPGTWVAIVGMPNVGPVRVPIEVVFESNTGHRLEAVTDRNGDAIANVTGNERWVRAGLRRKGASTDWQWFPVPTQWAERRIGLFVVDDTQWVIPQAFERMELNQQGEHLVSNDGDLIYSRE